MKKKHYIILSLLILVYLINGICSINATSITYDEGSHFNFAIKLLKGDPARTDAEKDNSKMPVSVLNTIPRLAEQILHKDLQKTDNGISDILNGRYITLFFSVLIILLVFQWSRELYGVNAGLFSAFLYIICPNSISNAILVTTDTYATFFLLATFYFFWRYCNHKRAKDFFLLALLLALSQLAKQSLFHLYVLLPLCWIIYTVVLKEKIQWSRLLKNVLIVAGISWLIINAGFIFWRMNEPLGRYHFISNMFGSLQSVLPTWLPVPFSESLVTGLDQAKYYDQLGGGYPNSSFGNVTILGHSSTGGSFWFYYFVSIFFKTPITYLILVGWAKYILLTKETFRSVIKNEFFLWAPIIYFLLLMSFFYKTQCGIRHIIFIYPLLFIFSGIIIKYFRGITDLPILVILSLFLMVSVSRYFNNYYPYTNEFIGHKKNAYQYVGASNLNFGQADLLLDNYLKKHTDMRRAPETPATGKFVLAVDDYLDIWNTGKYQWLRHLKPIGEVEYSYLLFDTGEAISH